MIDRFINHVSRRAPDFQIGGAENPYCNRWWMIPRNRFFNIYLHQFVRDDDDRALHDHPWPNCSILLRGAYWEITFDRPPQHGERLPTDGMVGRRILRPIFRKASTAHRVALPRGATGPLPCWSLFFTGPVILASRGKPKRLNADVRQVIDERRREHSRKPDGIYDRIERLVAGPYLELFARNQRPGWDCWGNETEKFAPAFDPDLDSLLSYNAAVKAVGEQVRAGAPVPPFFQATATAPGVPGTASNTDAHPNKAVET